jgi:hypothetical protein
MLFLYRAVSAALFKYLAQSLKSGVFDNQKEESDLKVKKKTAKNAAIIAASSIFLRPPVSKSLKTRDA